MRRATYRLQLCPDFGFEQATQQTGYLAALGVSHAYCSPYLQAAPGSSHGYDVIDHRRINEELGGAEGHRRFCEALNHCGLLQLLDVVPNHMAIGHYNPVWWDVLENGPSSRYADFFDIQWASHERRLSGRILLPILGNHSGRVIESGDIKLVREGVSFTIRYFEHRVPVSPRTLAEPLEVAGQTAGSEELLFLADAFRQLPAITATDAESLDLRHRDRGVLFRLLDRTLSEDPRLGEQVDAALRDIEDQPERLDAFLMKQHCRLAYWRVGSQDLGYRRFFDVDTLAALRMEDPRVFEETHALPLSWLRSGLLDGLRIDHPDGIQDPEEYLHRIHAVRSDAWLLVEKILEPNETLRESWQVAGTTGYDFLNVAARCFVNPEAEAILTRFYQEFTGDERSWEEHVLDAKRLVMRELLGSDVNRLTELFVNICEQHRRYRDFTRVDVHEVLLEMVASLPVYRTYVRPGKAPPHPNDLALLAQAASHAKSRRPDLDPELFEFLEAVLSLRVTGQLESELVWRFQQLSGPAMAKGAEDTACYRYLRFAALNEVGGAPGHFGTDVHELHVFLALLARDFPETMLATSTHDTKRSEDVRARLWVLSEMPDAWIERVLRWSEMLERYRTEFVDHQTEYLIYQTVVGAYPLSVDRLEQYLYKAMREAKQCTSWTRPDERYETAIVQFAKSALEDARFLRDLDEFMPPIIAAGRVNSLSQTLVKMTAPGVPDIYQGTELWDLSLVDPDNRQPIDFERRRSLLDQLAGMPVEHVASAMDEGLPKLFVIRRALELRRRRFNCFGPGASYAPLYAEGPGAAHVIAFQRDGGDIITAVPRLMSMAGDSLHDTHLTLPPGNFTDVLSGKRYSGQVSSLSELWQPLPVALLERERES